MTRTPGRRTVGEEADVEWSHFGLERQPFRPAVDAGSYFPAATHEAALATVISAFVRRESVVLLDGPSGVGKSLVTRKWLEHLLPDVPRVVWPSAQAQHPAELLQAVLFDLGQPYRGYSEQELRLSATGLLLDLATGSGYPTVLVLDEAQHLSQPAFEELRLLGNLETRRGAAVFTLLVAQPTLRDALRRPAYELFAQRLGASATLQPLSVEESAAYLRHHIRAAGGDPDEVLDDQAVELIARVAGGVPRILNRVAALSLELTAGVGADFVDVEAVLEALDRLGIDAPEANEPVESDEPVVLPHPERGPVAATGEAGARTGPKQKTTRKRSA